MIQQMCTPIIGSGRGVGLNSSLTCDPEHGSLGRVQDGSSLDLPLGSLMSGEVPGQRVSRCRGRRA